MRIPRQNPSEVTTRTGDTALRQPSTSLLAGPPDRFTPLYRLLDRQQIERISRGLYRRTDLPIVDLDLTEIAGRRPDSTICLESTFARHELIDAIPTRTDIAIPRGQKPAKTQAAVDWHLFEIATSLPRAIGPLRTALEILK